MVNLGGEVGCMISEGPWLFVGIPNVVKVGLNAKSPPFCSYYIYYSIITTIFVVFLFFDRKHERT